MHQIFADATDSFERSFRAALDQSDVDDETFAAGLQLMFRALDVLNALDASTED